jgi:A/G-specific adenine glycosylase
MQHNNISYLLLKWYDVHARVLPWRTEPNKTIKGMRTNPYYVWLSEVMLQQTTVALVKDYFRKFITRWPTVQDLAHACEDDVLKEWAGLGYYSRARNLHKAANHIMDQYKGTFPSTFQDVMVLSGIGRYSASAICAIAFGQHFPVVDGNVERVFSRLFAVETPIKNSKNQIYDYVEKNLSRGRPGDFAQACMDLGALICTPKQPKCCMCPLRDACCAFALGTPERFPIKLPKPLKPKRYGAAFVAMNSQGAVLLVKRANKGLLASMSAVPTSAWTARDDGGMDSSYAPFAAQWQQCGSVIHVFTHFKLELFVFKAHICTAFDHDKDALLSLLESSVRYWWSPRELIEAEALPTLMKKVLARAFVLL